MKKKIRTSNKTIAVIGEGITEKYYLNSLSDFIRVNIVPKLPKHTSMAQLEKSIKECTVLGYDSVYVLIDMDNKKEGKNRFDYYKLKNKYNQTTKNKCYIEFFENERCIEMWFLYHFKCTTKEYRESNDIVRELNTLCGYDKTEKFFIKSGGLHDFLCDHGGNFEKTLRNANKSMISKEKDGRNCTYSEMHKFFKSVPRK